MQPQGTAVTPEHIALVTFTTQLTAGGREMRYTCAPNQKYTLLIKINVLQNKATGMWLLVHVLDNVLVKCATDWFRVGKDVYWSLHALGGSISRTGMRKLLLVIFLVLVLPYTEFLDLMVISQFRITILAMVVKWLCVMVMVTKLHVYILPTDLQVVESV